MKGEIELFGMLAELELEKEHISAILDTLRKHRVAIAAEHIVAVKVVVEPQGSVSAHIYMTGGWEIMVFPSIDKVKIEHASW